MSGVENGPNWSRLVGESENTEIEKPISLDDIWGHGEPIGSNFGEHVYSYSDESAFTIDARKSGIRTAFCKGRKVPRAPGCP